MPSSFSRVAGGNISPSRFLVAGTASGNTVVQASATGTLIVGISQEGTRNAGGTGADDGFAAIAGGQITIYDNPNEDDCLLLLGSAVTAGNLLTSDSLGRGIPTSATGQAYGAQALFTTVSGQLARVKPIFGFT